MTVWGLRAGCLLALALLRTGRIGAERLILWQPVTSGKNMLTQFLRMRIAARLSGDRDRETVESMRERLSRGEALEVAGYELAPELAASVDKLSLVAPPGNLPVHWFEIASGGNRPLSPVAAATVEDWRRTGVSIEARVIAGEPFWLTQEITLAPALVEATLGAMGTTPEPTPVFAPRAG